MASKTNNQRHVLKVILLLMIIFIIQGCRVNYSFTGASVSPSVKTIVIHNFANNSPLVVPTLSRNLTQGLREYFTTQTSLALVERNGDLDLDGTITGYSISPQAIQGNETAAMNRLTITIHTKFVNRQDEKQNFEADFSKYVDFPSTPAPSPSRMEELIALVNEQLILDVFNRSLANW